MTDPQPYSQDELQPSDLSVYTQGRLSATDPNTMQTLDAALQEIRNYCRWHVTPVKSHTAVLDGPGVEGGLAVGLGGMYYDSGTSVTGVLRTARHGAGSLYLPTKQLRGITSITENGVPLDVSDVQFSRRGEVLKNNGQLWARGLGVIQVEFIHGYEPKDAIDWRRIVLNAADRMSLVRGLVGPFNAGIGPHRLSAHFGSSRPGNMAKAASWLDDLTAMIDVSRYVRIEA